MTRLHRKLSIFLALSLLLGTAATIWAQRRHPLYLHGRSDLRRAIVLMRIPDEPNVMRDMQQAVALVERAIHEIDAAAMFDRKDIEDNPPVDVRIGRGSRFREILRLIDSARHDIGSEEDNPRAAEWRNRAFGLIDDAMAVVRKGGYDKFRDEEMTMARPPIHPSYLRAISDLRFARALLWRQDWRDVMRDQRAAIEEIDRAIDEAKRAAIDDGKNLDDHPPVDTRLGWGDRFRRTMELLEAAQRDLAVEEDNRYAAGWRAAAMTNVNNAKAFVAKAQRAEYWH
jgi:hypothetical protein